MIQEPNKSFPQKCYVNISQFAIS